MHKLDIIYLTIVFLMVANSLMFTFLDLYSHTDKNKTHPLKGLIQGLQVIVFFIGAILILAILFDKSPTALLTGLGASAAVLMLIFKDSILGFVAGVQLSQNNMIRIGDWIQMPDGSANGNVQEITLNTVKVRNWDNTISTIPPYTLVSTTFKNWRGMTESDGRRVDKKIFLDLCSIEFCSEDMIADILKNVPLMEDYLSGDASPQKINKEYQMPTNSQLYRVYIERYLRAHPIVAQHLDLIIAQREPTQFGVPIEVYFFLKDKIWAEYETIQSDIFDHLLAMASTFGLRLYQLPMQN
jgi:small-conductance mechanosensitive channel